MSDFIIHFFLEGTQFQLRYRSYDVKNRSQEVESVRYRYLYKGFDKNDMLNNFLKNRKGGAFSGGFGKKYVLL